MNLEDKLTGVVVEVLKLDGDQQSGLAWDTPLSEVGMDSINCMDIVIQAEEVFGIAFEDHELLLDQLDTLGKLSAIIRGKLQPQPAN